jgi:hypothetical protein
MPFQLISWEFSGKRLTYDQWFGVLFLSPFLQTFHSLLFLCSLNVALEDRTLWISLWVFLSVFFWTIEDEEFLQPIDEDVAFIIILIFIKCGGFLRLFERLVTNPKRTMLIAAIIYLICVALSIIDHLFSYISLFNYIIYYST